MSTERHFADMSRYQSISDTSTPLEVVEWFAKNKGITNLDDPEVKIRTVIEHENQALIANQAAKKDRDKKALGEYIDALMNLEDGTAVHRRSDNHRKRKVGRPRNNTEMETLKGQEVLDTLKKSGVYKVASWDLSINYLNRIIRDVKALGHNIKTIKTGMSTIEFRLIKDKS